MKMRGLLAVAVTIQMGFGQYVFAVDLPATNTDSKTAKAGADGDPNPSVDSKVKPPAQPAGPSASAGTQNPNPPPGSSEKPKATNPTPAATSPGATTGTAGTAGTAGDSGSSGKSVPETTPKRATCWKQIHCNAFFKQFLYDDEGMAKIRAQMAANPGKECESLKEPGFLQDMLNQYDKDKTAVTEAGTPLPGICRECSSTWHSMVGQSSADGKSPETMARKILDNLKCDAKVAEQKAEPRSQAPAAPSGGGRVQNAPADESGGHYEAPSDVGRESSYREPEHEVVTGGNAGGGGFGGGGGFMNSNLMWGLGGALLGGLIGYKLGQNSAQQQYQMPYWQQMGPPPPPFGQGPGPFGGSPFMNRPGLPNVYPVGGYGQGGYGVPNFLPYGGGGQNGQPWNGGMTPVGGYQGGVGLGGYNLGTNFGGRGTPIYNGGALGGGAAPIYLPAH